MFGHVWLTFTQPSCTAISQQRYINGDYATIVEVKLAHAYFIVYNLHDDDMVLTMIWNMIHSYGGKADKFSRVYLVTVNDWPCGMSLDSTDSH